MIYDDVLDEYFNLILSEFDSFVDSLDSSVSNDQESSGGDLSDSD